MDLWGFLPAHEVSADGDIARCGCFYFGFNRWSLGVLESGFMPWDDPDVIPKKKL